jgi:hypothetical protein
MDLYLKEFVQSIIGTCNKLLIQLNYKQLNTPHLQPSQLTPPVITVPLIEFVVNKLFNLNFVYDYPRLEHFYFNSSSLIDVPDTLILTHKMIIMDEQMKHLLILPDHFSLHQKGHTIDFNHYKTKPGTTVLFVPFSKMEEMLKPKDQLALQEFFSNFYVNGGLLPYGDGVHILVSTIHKIQDCKDELDQFLSFCTKMDIYGATIKASVEPQKSITNFAKDVMNFISSIREPQVSLTDIWPESCVFYLNNLCAHVAGYLKGLEVGSKSTDLLPLYAQMITKDMLYRNEDTNVVVESQAQLSQYHSLRQLIESLISILPPLATPDDVCQRLIDAYNQYAANFEIEDQQFTETYQDTVQNIIYKIEIQPDVVTHKYVEELLVPLCGNCNPEFKSFFDTLLKQLLSQREMTKAVLINHLQAVRSNSHYKYFSRNIKSLPSPLPSWLEQVQSEFMNFNRDLVVQAFFDVLDSFLLLPYVNRQSTLILEQDIQTCEAEFSADFTKEEWRMFLLFNFYGYKISLERWSAEHNLTDPLFLYKKCKIGKLTERSNSLKIRRLWSQAFSSVLICSDPHILDENKCKVCLNQFSSLCKPESFGCSLCQRDVLITKWLNDDGDLLQQILKSFSLVHKNKFEPYMKEQVNLLVPCPVAQKRKRVVKQKRVVRRMVENQYKVPGANVGRDTLLAFMNQIKDAKVVDPSSPLFEGFGFLIFALKDMKQQQNKWSDVQVKSKDKVGKRVKDFIGSQVETSPGTTLIEVARRYCLLLVGPEEQMVEEIVEDDVDPVVQNLENVEQVKAALRLVQTYVNIVNYLNDTVIQSDVLYALDYFSGERESAPTELQTKLHRGRLLRFLLRNQPVFERILYNEKDTLEDQIKEAKVQNVIDCEKESYTEEKDEMISTLVLQQIIRKHISLQDILFVGSASNFKVKFDGMIRDIVKVYPYANPSLWMGFRALQTVQTAIEADKVQEVSLGILSNLPIIYEQILGRIRAKKAEGFMQSLDISKIEFLATAPTSSEEFLKLTVALLQDHEVLDIIQILSYQMIHTERLFKVFVDVFQRYLSSFEFKFYEPLLNSFDLSGKLNFILESMAVILEKQTNEIKLEYERRREVSQRDIYKLFDDEAIQINWQNINQSLDLYKTRHPSMLKFLLLQAVIQDKAYIPFLSLIESSQVEKYKELRDLFMQEIGAQNLFLTIPNLIDVLKDQVSNTKSIVLGLSLNSYNILLHNFNYTVEDNEYILEKGTTQLISKSDIISNPEVLYTFYYTHRLQLSVWLKNAILKQYPSLSLASSSILDIKQPRMVEAVPSARWSSKFWRSLLVMLGKDKNEDIVKYFYGITNTILYFYQILHFHLSLDRVESSYPYNLSRTDIQSIIKYRNKLLRYVSLTELATTENTLDIVFYREELQAYPKAVNFLRSLYANVPTMCVELLKFVLRPYAEDLNKLTVLAIACLMEVNVNEIPKELIAEVDISSLFSTVKLKYGRDDMMVGSSYMSRSLDERQTYLESNNFETEFEE